MSKIEVNRQFKRPSLELIFNVSVHAYAKSY
jgi:hypothetical protein